MLILQLEKNDLAYKIQLEKMNKQMLIKMQYSGVRNRSYNDNYTKNVANIIPPLVISWLLQLQLLQIWFQLQTDNSSGLACCRLNCQVRQSLLLWMSASECLLLLKASGVTHGGHSQSAKELWNIRRSRTPYLMKKGFC